LIFLERNLSRGFKHSCIKAIARVDAGKCAQRSVTHSRSKIGIMPEGSCPRQLLQERFDWRLDDVCSGDHFSYDLFALLRLQRTGGIDQLATGSQFLEGSFQDCLLPSRLTGKLFRFEA